VIRITVITNVITTILFFFISRSGPKLSWLILEQPEV
jgi:hypothetical protein